MRKFMVIAIPIVTLIIFILIMISADFLKRPIGRDDNVPEAIQEIMQDIDKERWKEAGRGTEKLEVAWKKVIKRVQFSAERDEINALSMNIARLRGAIMAKDKANALSELNEAYEHWKDIGK